ncbi:MAG: B12-binding domain-containing radical SAM protein [Nitrospinae bacterium]|nr:B12-binding domain-containing radical SAM protein [Nitrospinota bacterium]
MGIKVFFIYPNPYGMNMLPPAIAIFSALLKNEGHQVEIFDTTFYPMDKMLNADASKLEALTVQPYDMEGKGIRLRTSDWKKDFNEQLTRFKPDLIALSVTESMWNLGMKVVEEAREYKVENKVPVIVGGVFPTFAPHLVVKEELIDLVCVGEGENAIIDLCEKIEKKEGYSDVTNLWVKKDGKLLKRNSIIRPVDVNKIPLLDLSLFGEERLYRPMMGKVYKMLPVETQRGCPYTCTFCNSPDQDTLYKEESGEKFHRKKSMQLVFKELKHFKENYGIEYVYFWADTFLAMTKREFDEFCEMYSDIKLPFWMQTRPETVNDYNMRKLSEVGLHRVSFGIEHGNEKFRRKILDRRWENKDIIANLRIPEKYGIPMSVNNITGFPTETKELAFDTIELNRQINSDNQNIHGFVPFHGTPLRKMCEDLGLIKPEALSNLFGSQSIMNMPQYPPHEIDAVKKCFNLYVKFPKSRWKEIYRAEKNDAEGNRIYEDLRKEFVERYLIKADTSSYASIDRSL